MGGSFATAWPATTYPAAAVLRSRRHAEMLFDAVVAQLGEEGWHETANGGAIRRLFRRDPAEPTQLVPWPLLELNVGDRFGVVSSPIQVGDAPIDVPLPEPLAENVPTVLVPLELAPADAPPFGSWTTLLGARGATTFAACRRKQKGFTLIGRHVLGDLDLDRLDAEIDREDRRHEERLRAVVESTPGEVERWPCRTTQYRVEAEGGLVLESWTQCESWHPGDIDGDVVARRVVRQRWA